MQAFCGKKFKQFKGIEDSIKTTLFFGNNKFHTRSLAISPCLYDASMKIPFYSAPYEPRDKQTLPRSNYDACNEQTNQWTSQFQECDFVCVIAIQLKYILHFGGVFKFHNLFIQYLELKCQYEASICVSNINTILINTTIC